MGQKERRVWPEAAGSDFPGARRGSWDPLDWSHGDAKAFSGLESEPGSIPRFSQTGTEPGDR